MTDPRVLVVEDDARNTALLRAALEPAGFEVEYAATVAEARGALTDGLPDVVLLDLRLPDEPGYVIAREIRAREDGAGPLILAVSASILEASRREALEAGCDAFVEKPISPHDLVVRLRGWIAGRQ